MTWMTRRLAFLSVLACTVSAWAGATTGTQTPGWPSKPVRIVVGFPAGSSPDLTARTLADGVSGLLGQPVVVENRVGAGGNIGADLVAKATDQHTLGLMINGNLTIAKRLNPKLAYDPHKDLQPISLVGVSPLVLVAPTQAPGTDATSFIAAARQASAQWSYGSPGVGTVGHIGMELFKARIGTQAVHVPYPGYAQVATAMIGGDIQLSMMPPALAMAQVRGGKLRAIGVTSSGRSALAPELPSMAEAGVDDFNLEIWNAVAAPATLPQPIVQRLAELISTLVREPAIRQKLHQQGWQVVGSSPEGLAKRIQADTQLLGGMITKLGLGQS